MDVAPKVSLRIAISALVIGGAVLGIRVSTPSNDGELGVISEVRATASAEPRRYESEEGALIGEVTVSLPDPVAAQRPEPPDVIRSSVANKRHVLRDETNVLVVTGDVEPGTTTRGRHRTVVPSPSPATAP